MVNKIIRRPVGSSFIRGICYVEGCKRLQRNKGYSSHNGKRMWDKVCDLHHRQKYGIKAVKEFNQRIRVENTKCEKCGWDKGPCDRHRIDPQKMYDKKNVKILCPNCHRLLNLGLL